MPEPPAPGLNGLPAVSGTGKTARQHWNWVLRKLGAPIVDIELTQPGDKDPISGELLPEGETHMDDCLEETRLWYSQRVGFKRVLQVPLTNGQGAYLMGPTVIDVIDVWLPSFQLPTLDADQFSFTYFSLLFGQWTNPNVAPMPYSDLVQRLQYLEEIGRIFSTDRDFKWTPETRTLEILPAPGVLGGFGARDSSALVTIWDREIRTEDLDPMETRFFRRYLWAEAMETLGEIRRTSDTWPMMGNEKALNGEALKADAAELKAKVEDDIKNWKRAVPLITG